MDTPESSQPKILENLAAAGLVSHELIGDPSRLATESAALAALCARIGGAVYRLGAFHYAFRIAEGDLGGALAGLEPERRGTVLEASLLADLGEEAVWISAVNLGAEEETAVENRTILFLRAAHGAVAAAMTEAPELRAVIAAGVAARSAETAAALAAEAIEAAVARAGAGAAATAGALAGLERRIGALEASLGGLAGQIEAARAAEGEALARTLGATVTEAVRLTVAEAVGEAVSEAVTQSVEQAVTQSVEQVVTRSVERAVTQSVADTVAGAVAEVMAGSMSQAVAEAARGAVADTVAGRVEVALGAAMRQATASRAADPALERAVGAMETIVRRLSDQAARAAEDFVRQDALASGMAALETALEALTAATVAQAAEESARNATRDAAFGAFENRLGLTLAEFLARLAPSVPGRIVEMGRTAPAVPSAAPPAAAAAAPPAASRAEALAEGAFRAAQAG